MSRKSNFFHPAKLTKPFKLTFVIFLLATASILGRNYFSPNTAELVSSSTLGQTIERIDLDRSFSLVDNNQPFTLNLLSAELTREIILNDQKATAKDGKRFLVLNLKLSNPTDQDQTINSRQLLSLTTDPNSSFQSPVFHNDPLLLPAHSSLETTLGFSIDLQLSTAQIIIYPNTKYPQTIDLNF